VDGHVPEDVVAKRIHHRDLGAEESGHDRLVGALAAEPELEVVALDGLPGVGHAGGVGDEVDHRAADDGDARLVTHGDNGA
jgi:hypothetical protein